MIVTQLNSLTNDELARAIESAARLSEDTGYDRRAILTEHLKALCAEQAERAKRPLVTIPSTNQPGTPRPVGRWREEV